MKDQLSMVTEKIGQSVERARRMTPEAVANETQLMIRKIGDAIAPNTTTSERFRLIARAIGADVTAGQVKRMFYGEWLQLPAHVFLSVRNAYGQHLERAKRRAEHDALVFRSLQEKWNDGCDLSSFSRPKNCDASHSS